MRIAVARDVTERKRAESMQAALYAISEAAQSAGDPLALFQLIHQIIGNLLPAPNFFVAMVDESTGQLNFPYQIDEHGQTDTLSQQVMAAICAQVIGSGQPLLLPLAPDATPSLSWLGVPLTSHKGTIGALVLKSYPDGTRYTENDKELLQFVSTQVAIGIERKQLQARLQYMAQYDALTGLPNRACLYDRLETALSRARRQQVKMSLLYLDLDKFKQVNDTFGHAAGDVLLQEVAERLKQCVRGSDTVARIGGDEFVVLLENIQQPQHALVVAAKIRHAVNRPIALDGHAVRIMPSVGIAHYPEHGDSAQSLLKHADEAMYSAKTGGTRVASRRSREGD